MERLKYFETNVILYNGFGAGAISRHSVRYRVQITRRTGNTMIDTYYTFIIFGYRVDELSKWAKVPVVAMCDKCCEYRTVRYDSYTDLCSPCSHKETIRNEEWNHNISAGLMGHVVTEETRCNISNGSKGRKMPPLTDDHRRNLSESLKGRTIYWNHKISAALTGRTLSESHRKNISKSQVGKILSDKHKKKIGDAERGDKNPNYGKKMSDEQRKKISATKQGISVDEWEGFSHNKQYCPKFDEDMRNKVREKYNNKCFACDKTQEDNLKQHKEKLSVHHTDLNKDAGCDDHEWRLVPLCKSCHGSSHTDPLKSRIEYLRADEECAHV